MDTPAPLPPPSPLPRSPEVQAAVDAEHLWLLKVAYYIAGGATAAVSSIFIFHFVFMLIIGLNPHAFEPPRGVKPDNPPPPGLFLAFAAFVGMFILLGWIFGALQIYAGRCLASRQHLLFIQVIAGIECIFIPWGTAIGVFTFLLLNRPSVRSLFLGGS